MGGQDDPLVPQRRVAAGQHGGDVAADEARPAVRTVAQQPGDVLEVRVAERRGQAGRLEQVGDVLGGSGGPRPPTAEELRRRQSR